MAVLLMSPNLKAETHKETHVVVTSYGLTVGKLRPQIVLSRFFRIEATLRAVRTLVTRYLWQKHVVCDVASQKLVWC
jgi:hypothetical protein